MPDSPSKMHPGISEEAVRTQLNLILKGLKYARLVRPCVLDDGIRRMEDPANWAQVFQQHSVQLDVVKFVPASGAASRMFRHAESADQATQALREELQKNFRQLPFYPVLKQAFPEVELWINGEQWDKVFDLVLNQPGLGYRKLPKGMVPFHRYKQQVRTAFQEHLAEAPLYAQSGDGISRLHFTVGTDWQGEISAHLAEAADGIEGTSYQLETSVQHPETDTICVTSAGQPLKVGGELYLRPGGHGSLLANLDQLDADLVFVKNIDNVQPDRDKAEVALYKQALAGILLQAKQTLDSALTELHKEGKLPGDAAKQLLEEMGHDVNSFSRSTDWKIALDRPMRVCGMVRNVGEPGGGPYWVKDASGAVSPQIVERPQIDLSDPEQKDILRKSTHFNPVDLVCAKRRYDGTDYSLMEFSDPSTSFIAEKSVRGQSVKALEHPGLWNGAMAKWNTLFVEVPLSTFSPVKPVNDLLRPSHQV